MIWALALMALIIYFFAIIFTQARHVSTGTWCGFWMAFDGFLGGFSMIFGLLGGFSGAQWPETLRKWFRRPFEREAVSDSLRGDVEWQPEAERYFHSLPEAANF